MAGELAQTIPYTDITFADVLGAVFILAAGYLLARIIIGFFNRGLHKTRLPELVIEFLTRFISSLLYVFVILAAVSVFVDMSSVVLGLSAVIGLILGFGMQDTLTNLGAGLWLAALRPIDKGEYVEVNGSAGTVAAVGIMATELLTPDNKMITIPNRLVWNNPIINATRMPTRRVDVIVGISYGADLDRAIEIAIYVMKGHGKILGDPAPAVMTTELADSSVNLQLRAWTNTADYWDVKRELTNAIVKTYREQDIEIPFPQLDVHLIKE
jgi:small-conductance mechanosensitive channel